MIKMEFEFVVQAVIDCQHYCSLFWDDWLLPTYKLRDFYSMKERSDGIWISNIGSIISIGNWTLFLYL